MKTAISIPDPIFQSAEKLADRLGITRSELYAKAVSSFVKEYREHGITEKLNAVYGELESELEADYYALQYNSLQEEEW